MSEAPEETRVEEPRPEEDGAQAVEQDFEKLLADAHQEKEEYLELARRTKADFENFRKRVAGDVQAAQARGKVEVARGLVDVIDNFERALEAAGIDSVASAATSDDVGPVEQGWLLTYRDLINVLRNAGVEVIDPKGEKFDPTKHEALSTHPVEGTESGVVVEVLQKGYALGDQLVRPARVVVSA